MNLGDGLLFELENGKPKLILLSNGVEKNTKKLLQSRGTNILSSRQPSYMDRVLGGERPARQQAAGGHRESRNKAAAGGGAAAPSMSSTPAERSTASTVQEGGSKSKPIRQQQQQSSNSGSLRANGKRGTPQASRRKVGLKDAVNREDGMVVLTCEQLQQLISNIRGSGQQPPGGDESQGSQSGSSVSEGRGGDGEMKEEDRGGGEAVKEGEEGGAYLDMDNKDERSGCLFSWMEAKPSDSRLAIEAKKAQWRRELDEQVALKQQQQQQQRSAPGRVQAEDGRDSVLSVQSSVSHREWPAAIRSCLRLGEVTPMAKVLSTERKEQERRHWLEELDRQREETVERKRREMVLQNQTEDHNLWASHFDSLQLRPHAHSVTPSAPPLAPPSCVSGRRDWEEPSSSLSLVWDAGSSGGAESVAGSSADASCGFPSRASYLRTMTALLDPTQLEERGRRRLKALEQQRAIEAQIDERQQQREREEAQRRREEEEEARRMQQEREWLQKRYEEDVQRERPKESQQGAQLSREHSLEALQETRATNHTEHSDEDASSSLPPFKDTAVQTEAVPSLLFRSDAGIPAQYQAPPPPLPTSNSKNPSMRSGKENMCVSGGGGGRGGAGPYEAFARTERNKKEKKRPEWNTPRPGQRFVPASERYPTALQRNRQESRLRRQVELLALQERSCVSRAERSAPPPQNQDPQVGCSTRSGGGHRVASTSSNNIARSQQASPPLPVQDFIPYIRTDEITLNPLAPPDLTSPPLIEVSPHSSLSPPRELPHTPRQQQILRGLAQLRQGLLQKQRELELDLNPHLMHHDSEHRAAAAMAMLHK